jgi:RNA polymerase sigma-70 factor (ECF subfamily)
MTEEYFNEIYGETKSLTLKVILSFKAVDFQTAEDLLQQVYLRFYEKCSQENELPKVCAWLRTTAKNTTIKYLKYINAAKRAVTYMDMPYEEYDDDSALNGLYLMIETEINQHKRSRIAKIKRLINSLPKKQKQAMRLVYLKGYRVKDAAVVMGSNENCLGFLLNKAKNTIKNKINLCSKSILKTKDAPES